MFLFLQDEKIIAGYSLFTKAPFISIEFARLLKADLGALNYEEVFSLLLSIYKYSMDIAF